MKQSISIVIPVFNSERSLPELIVQLNSLLKDIALEFEIILVDDASIDGIWDVIQSLCKSYPRIRAIQLMKNSGQANATICGLGHAKYDIIITLDDDLQHPPDQIPVLLAAFLENPHIDCVYGTFNEKHHKFYRNIGSWLINFIDRSAFKLPQKIKTSGFRVIRHNLVREITRRETANPSISVLIFGCTRNIMSIPITHKPHFSRKSNYTFSKQFRLSLGIIGEYLIRVLREVSNTPPYLIRKKININKESYINSKD